MSREKNRSSPPWVCPTRGYCHWISRRAVPLNEASSQIPQLTFVEFFVSFGVLSAPMNNVDGSFPSLQAVRCSWRVKMVDCMLAPCGWSSKVVVRQNSSSPREKEDRVKVSTLLPLDTWQWFKCSIEKTYPRYALGPHNAHPPRQQQSAPPVWTTGWPALAVFLLKLKFKL